MTTRNAPLSDYLARQYRFDVIADPDGGYVIVYPDLPGCMTQVEMVEEVSEAAIEIFELWMASEYEGDLEIPEPTYPEAYSGKFVLRLPKSMHRKLAERADDEGVSLNQFAVALLAEGVGRSADPNRTPRLRIAEAGADPDSRLVLMAAEEPATYDGS